MLAPKYDIPMEHILTKKPTSSISVSSWARSIREFQLDDIFDTTVLGRSYEYIAAVSHLQKNRQQVVAQLPAHGYEVKLTLSQSMINGSCTCPYPAACKHIAATILKLRQLGEEEE